ncbi:Peptidoglycan hydrolase VirB1, involved in T-DNA transfer [Candidatus Burkholderia verschuerenii]|uniref:Peptidoglycan hydrolase VirB1, involved in T-DNA transfer n=1 Tax=Candidatus Burkholderia verschuerenii TaxID=242163 RepID=A0A0L0ME43_9BURK|nr:lytic transglycosylase domain-containing protein [Candidatus Burkholderia verschuerenii]KND60588.1 Peptidoglycan hydrolase VirB1, involved in T-DNA transfer [Candidatus Burkholderia verschuerenii]
MRKLLLLTTAALVASPICAFSGGLAGLSAKPSLVGTPITVKVTPVATPERVGSHPPGFAALAARCAPSIHIRTLSSLVRWESRANPYAININGGYKLTRQPNNATEAAATAQNLLDQGYNIDVGLGQINSNNFRALGVGVDALFAPCANLRVAAQVLGDCYARAVAVDGEGQAALRGALSCYNTGSLRRGIQNGYVRNVVAQANLPVPELIPLGGEDSAREPVLLHGNRVAAASTSQDAAPEPPAKPKPSSGEADAFTVSADADAFSADPENENGRK